MATGGTTVEVDAPIGPVESAETGAAPRADAGREKTGCPKSPHAPPASTSCSRRRRSRQRGVEAWSLPRLLRSGPAAPRRRREHHGLARRYARNRVVAKRITAWGGRQATGRPVTAAYLTGDRAPRGRWPAARNFKAMIEILRGSAADDEAASTIVLAFDGDKAAASARLADLRARKALSASRLAECEALLEHAARRMQ